MYDYIITPKVYNVYMNLKSTRKNSVDFSQTFAQYYHVDLVDTKIESLRISPKTLQKPIKSSFLLEFTCCSGFLNTYGNCYCSTNHWVVTHSETICFSMLYCDLICHIMLINKGFTRNGLWRFVLFYVLLFLCIIFLNVDFSQTFWVL